MKQFTLALLVASSSAIKLSTYGDCDWECGATGSPEEQWRSYGYPHRGADLKKPLDHQQRWDTYLPDFHQKAACNCANFVQRNATYIEPFNENWSTQQKMEWSKGIDASNHDALMGRANMRDSERIDGVRNQEIEDQWRSNGIVTPWGSSA